MEKSKGFSFRMKMLLFGCFFSVISAVVGVMAYHQASRGKEAYQEIMSKEFPKYKFASEMLSAYRRASSAIITLGLPNIASSDADEAMRRAQSAIDDYSKLQNLYDDLGFAPGQQDHFEKSKGKWNEFKSVGSEVVSTFKSGKAADLTKVQSMLLKEFPEKSAAYLSAATSWVDWHDLAVKKAQQEAIEKASSSFAIVLLIIGAGTILGLAVGMIFAQKIGFAIGRLAHNLGEGADQVSHAAEKIASSAQGLSNSATQQASSLEETVATMEELTAMVRQNTDNAKQAASLASSTRDIAMKGEREIKTLIDSINSISADSKKIEEITTVIDDIAFQTNLLALNAAVEAARAGEQGKGFAVVAEAVRSLAQRSSLAAKDIAELIKNSVEKIEIGSKQASQGGAVLGEIVNSVKKVADLNNEISNASDEQNSGIMQISQAMNQLDQITQSNASASEETASSAEKLSTQSKTLSQSVNTLERMIVGSSSGHSGGYIAKTSGSSSKSSSKSSKSAHRSSSHSSSSSSSSNVVEMKSHPKAAAKKAAPSASSSVIPFDEDHGDGMTATGAGKVGTTDGF